MSSTLAPSLHKKPTLHWNKHFAKGDPNWRGFAKMWRCGRTVGCGNNLSQEWRFLPTRQRRGNILPLGGTLPSATTKVQEITIAMLENLNFWKSPDCPRAHSTKFLVGKVRLPTPTLKLLGIYSRLFYLFIWFDQDQSFLDKFGGGQIFHSIHFHLDPKHTHLCKSPISCLNTISMGGYISTSLNLLPTSSSNRLQP